MTPCWAESALGSPLRTNRGWVFKDPRENRVRGTSAPPGDGSIGTADVPEAPERAGRSYSALSSLQLATRFTIANTLRSSYHWYYPHFADEKNEERG